MSDCAHSTLFTVYGDDMTLNQFIVLLSIIWSAVAAVANGFGARKARGGVQMVCVARAALAFGYSVSYSWLFFHEQSRLHWSYVMSGAALVVWPVVWTMPPIAILQKIRQDTRTHEALIVEANALLNSQADNS